MTEQYLSHHGIKGQKWGVRRFQNPDGSLTTVGKKHYKKSLADDSRIRYQMHERVYDSGKIANLYNKKLKSVNKQYDRAMRKDPNQEKLKTQQLSRDKKYLEKYADAYNEQHRQNMTELKDYVNNMINKYADTKIKPVKTKTNKDGTEFINSFLTSFGNSNATYSLRTNFGKDGEGKLVRYYTPVKTRQYYHYY